MRPTIFIGLDGGGSRCRARICDEGGAVLGEGVDGPANIHTGFDLALRSVRSASRSAAIAAGLGEADLANAHAGLGLAGAGPRAMRQRFLAELQMFASAVVATDAYVAWLGAHRGEDGAVLVLGTGSFGLGRVAGRWHHVGGWGPVISDDGGGQAIGREAVRRTTWAIDGRIHATPLTLDIAAKIGGDPARIADFIAAASPPDYAALAPAVFAHACRRDPHAMAIVSSAAEAASRMVSRLLDLGIPAVSLMGGLADALLPWLRPPVRRALRPPQGDALDGAIRMARATIPR